MVTLTIIVIIVIVYWAYKAEEKQKKVVDVVNHDARAKKIQQMPTARINFNELSTAEKALSLTLSDSSIPVVFSFSDGNVFLKYKTGKIYTNSLDKMEVCFTFEPSTNSRIAEIQVGQQVLYTLQENDYLTSTPNWNKIFDILSLSGVTHRVDCISQESRDKAIKDYQLQKTLQTTGKILRKL